MAAFQGSEEDFIGASIFVNVTVFSSGAILTWALAKLTTLCPFPTQALHLCDLRPAP